MTEVSTAACLQEAGDTAEGITQGDCGHGNISSSYPLPTLGELSSFSALDHAHMLISAPKETLQCSCSSLAPPVLALSDVTVCENIHVQQESTGPSCGDQAGSYL